MHQEKWKKVTERVTSCEWRGLTVTVLITLIVSGVFTVVLSVVSKAHAADNWGVDGANGVLQVRGALSESACRLEMTSAWQEINLGTTTTGRLRQVGDRGTPVTVQLKLQDCISGPARTLDERSGNLRWSPGQPAVTVRFIAPADINNPELIQVQGAGGLALRVTDKLGRDIRLGSRGASLLLTPGNNQLTYTITPERTRAPLQAGSYRAQVNFGLSYE